MSLTQRCLVSDVLKENVQRLQQLDANKARASALLTHDAQKVAQHVLLQEEAVREGGIYFQGES